MRRILPQNLLTELGGGVCVGPLLIGAAKPVNILSGNVSARDCEHDRCYRTSSRSERAGHSNRNRSSYAWRGRVQRAVDYAHFSAGIQTAHVCSNDRTGCLVANGGATMPEPDVLTLKKSPAKKSAALSA